jgi:tetratricopeptide (TPR) repeat protein
MLTKHLSLSLLILQLSLGASLTFAQDKPKKKIQVPKADDPSVLYEEGSTHFKAGDYAKALDNFKQVYVLTKQPSLLYNIGQCQRFLGLFDEALRSFRLFIRDDPTNSLVENAKARIEEIEADLAKKNALGSIQVMTNPEGAKIFVDEKDLGPGPIDMKGVPSGEHTISVKKEGFYPYELRFELQPGQAFSIRVPLREEVKLTQEKFDPLQPKYFYMAAGGTGVLGSAFGLTAVLFSSKAAKKQDLADGSDFSAEVRTSQRLKIPSVVLLGTSLFAVTSGLFLRLAEKKKEAQPCQPK